jgi:phosphonoacetate hydrolase
VAKAVSTVPGVDAVLTRSEAARRFHLLPSRIGDLVVLADKQTVFGDLDTETEALPAEYRSHGSMYERDVPLIIHNASAKLSPGDFRYNRDLARWLYPLRSSSL